MGFETEFSPKNSYWDKLIEDKGIRDDKIPDFISKHFYFKDDASCGMEMNSFPFNYNWFVNNGIFFKKSIDFLKKHGKVDRNCGFHIHISKKFFSKEHSSRFCKFFYNNENFFKRLSLRNGTSGLSCYASFNYTTSEKYSAVNKIHKNTLEVRIFQGTLNWKVICSYLETIYSIAMYTKQDMNPTLDAYKRFIKKEKIYKNSQWLINNYSIIVKNKTWKR